MFWFLAFFYSIILGPVSYVTALFIKDEGKKSAFYQEIARLWGRLLTNAALLDVRVEGLENIPAGEAVIFTPNHQSFLDIFILLKILPYPFRFVVMRKLFKVPIIGHHITQAGFISLDRKDRKNSIETIHRVVDLLNTGESFVIFPEGKLTKDGTVGGFGRGTSIIIQRSKKAVVPISIDGTFRAMPKGQWRIKRGAVTVKIGRPVRFEDYHDDTAKHRSMELGSKLRDIVIGLKDK